MVLNIPEIDGSRWMLDRATDIQDGDWVELRNNLIVGPIRISHLMSQPMIQDKDYKFAWIKNGQPWGDNNPLSRNPHDIVRRFRKSEALEYHDKHRV